jgi:Chitin synthase export chaperone
MGFGDFDTLCHQAALPLCSLVGGSSLLGTTGIETQCYSRSIELANTIIFQGATDFMHILALIMTAIMIIHVRSKFTAVGMLASSSISLRLLMQIQQAGRKSPPFSTSTWL